MKVPKIISGFGRETLQFDMKTLPKLNAYKIICFHFNNIIFGLKELC